MYERQERRLSELFYVVLYIAPVWSYEWF